MSDLEHRRLLERAERAEAVVAAAEHFYRHGKVSGPVGEMGPVVVLSLTLTAYLDGQSAHDIDAVRREAVNAFADPDEASAASAVEDGRKHP